MYKGVVTGIAFEASQTNAEATADLGNLTTLMEDGALAAVVSWLIPDRANAPADLKIEQIGFRTKEGGKHAEVSFKDVADVGVELKHVSELYLPDVVKGWLTKKIFSSNLGIVMFVQYSNGTTRYPASGTTPLLIAIDNQGRADFADIRALFNQISSPGLRRAFNIGAPAEVEDTIPQIRTPIF